MRKEEFLPDGKAVRVAPFQVVQMWKLHVTRIPAQYALGTAQHESNFAVNEVDTEDSGFVSKGIFQLSDEEAIEVGFPNADLLDLGVATEVFIALQEKRLSKIIETAGLDENNLPSDVWAYLALAHNQGLGACLKTIQKHGLDWAAYKANNPNETAIAAYGDDCSSGIVV